MPSLYKCETALRRKGELVHIAEAHAQTRVSIADPDHPDSFLALTAISAPSYDKGLTHV